jgi:hypothetical protein
VETDFRARSAGRRAPGAGRRAAGRCADSGRLLIAGLDPSRIGAAVSSRLFSSGADVTGPRQYATDPFGAAFLLLIECDRAAPARRFANLASAFGELTDEFPARRKMAVRG